MTSATHLVFLVAAPMAAWSCSSGLRPLLGGMCVGTIDLSALVFQPTIHFLFLIGTITTLLRCNHTPWSSPLQRVYTAQWFLLCTTVTINLMLEHCQHPHAQRPLITVCLWICLFWMLHVSGTPRGGLRLAPSPECHVFKVPPCRSVSTSLLVQAK